jgi:hypothetical protein
VEFVVTKIFETIEPSLIEDFLGLRVDQECSGQKANWVEISGDREGIFYQPPDFLFLGGARCGDTFYEAD